MEGFGLSAVGAGRWPITAKLKEWARNGQTKPIAGRKNGLNWLPLAACSVDQLISFIAQSPQWLVIGFGPSHQSIQPPSFFLYSID